MVKPLPPVVQIVGRLAPSRDVLDALVDKFSVFLDPLPQGLATPALFEVEPFVIQDP